MRAALSILAALFILSAAATGQDAKKNAGDADDRKKAEINEVAGQTFAHWIAQISAKDPSKREVAMRMVQDFEPEKAQKAVPVIIAELKKHNRPNPIDLSVRMSGAGALGMILSAVKEPNKEQVKDAVAILRAYAKDEQLIVRTRAVQALGQLTLQSLDVQDALDDVIRIANDPHTWQARQAGLETMTRIAQVKALLDKEAPPARVLGNLYKALNDNSMEVRVTAVKSLCVFKNLSAGQDVTRLRALEGVAAKDPEVSLHIWAELAIMTVKDKVETRHLLTVIKMLTFPGDPSIRVQAAQSLGMIGAQEIDDPKNANAKGDARNPKAKIKVLTGADRKLVVQKLTEGLNDDDLNVASACILALFQMEPDAAITPVAQMLNDKDRNRRMQAARVLAAAGEKARLAENSLIVKLFDPDAYVAAACISALVAMKSMNAVPALEKLAKDPQQKDPKVQEFVTEAATEAIRVIIDADKKKAKKDKAPN
jgi:HEAT repeat protein